MWWGVRLGEGTRGPQKKKKKLTLTFFFFLSEWDVTVSVCVINLSMVWKLRSRR